MILPRALPVYEERNEAETRRAIAEADDQNLKKNADLNMDQARVILKAPDGSRWYLTVDNMGNVGSTEV